MKKKNDIDDIKHVIRELAKSVHRAKGLAAKPRPGKTGQAGAKKKARLNPTELTLDEEQLTVEILNGFLPADCRFGVDLWDRNWRLSAFGRNYGRSWLKYGQKGAAQELIRLAWSLAIGLGHAVECPFENLELSF